MNERRTWTVLELINRTTLYFREKSIDNPRLNAEQLLGHVLGMSRVQLYLAFERPVSEPELNRYRELVRRRSTKEPLQYLMEKTEFMDCTFIVKPGVLIPRPETELLVETAADTIREEKLSAGRLLDIGTGSGCIAISLKKIFPDLDIVATDISAEALKVAGKNAHLNGVTVQNGDSATETVNNFLLLQHDIREPWPERPGNCFDVITCNPPYISLQEYTALPEEVREFEPRAALTDEADGLIYYGTVLDRIFIQKDLNTRYLFMEMSGTQSREISDLAQSFTAGEVTILEDLNQIPRILKIKVNS